VAGVYARTDERRGVWAAPAGRDAVIDGVGGLATFGTSAVGAITRAEQARLQTLGVNVIRPPDVTAGPTVWGARTLAGADHLGSDWKYVPVRRLASFIEHSLEQSLAWAAHEPNGEPLWAEARRLADTLMTDLFRRGAVQGVTPREAFVVRCDASTMTQDDIEQGRLVVEVGMAPLRPAEFIVLRIGAWTRRPED
jgi:phage tail sheath protein FI